MVGRSKHPDSDLITSDGAFGKSASIVGNLGSGGTIFGRAGWSPARQPTNVFPVMESESESGP